MDQGDTDEAIAFLEDATTHFPRLYEIAQMLAETLQADAQRLEASITAQEFAIGWLPITCWPTSSVNSLW